MSLLSPPPQESAAMLITTMQPKQEKISIHCGLEGVSFVILARESHPSHTLLTKRSESNLQEVRQESRRPPPNPWETRGPNHDPTDEPLGSNYQHSPQILTLQRRAARNMASAPAFITAALLGSQSQFSTFLHLIFYSLF